MSKPVKHRGKWRIRWVDENGSRQSEVYDSYRDAKIMLEQHKAEVTQIKEGIKIGYLRGKTFNDLADWWIKFYAPNKRSFKDDESIIKCHFRPAFGRLKLAQIGTHHIERFRMERKHLAIKTVSNILSLLKTMLNRAVDLGWLVMVPKFKVPRVPIHNLDFSYLKTDEEIKNFLSSAKQEEDAMVEVVYRTAIYTGLRAGELAGLNWDDVDFNRGIITVQRSYNGPTKTGEIRRIPIFNILQAPLNDWMQEKRSTRIVFPNQRGRRLGKCHRIFQEKLHRVLERAGFERVKRNNKLRYYVRFHDLRHTFASHFMMHGGDLFKLQKILGHKSISMTLRYAHLSPDAFAGEYDRFGAGGEIQEATVIPIEKGKKIYDGKEA